MTRTARRSAKKSIPATPWSELKQSPEKLEEDSDEATALRKVKKSHLKLTKKTKLKGGLAKRLLKKLKEKTRKKVRFELDDVDMVPLLETTIETPHSPSVSDDEENAIAGNSSMEPQSGTIAEEPSSKRKKRRKRKVKVAEFAQEVAPLLKSDSDVSDSEQPKSILKRRRLENDGFFSKSKGNKDGPYNSSEQVDEKREKNREARRMRRQKRKVCFHCRQPGHHVNNCPQSSQAGSCCFKCGAATHTSKKCKAKVPQDEYPYAKCFICGEIGHLSRSCPDNPRGLYPKGGGCKICGSVEHLKANCPQGVNHRRTIKSEVGVVIANKSADAEDFGEVNVQAHRRTHIKPKQHRVIKF